MIHHTALVLAVALAVQHAHGQGGMDFDQTKTVHHFRLAPDGGTVDIEVRRAGDVDLRETVRMHLRHLAEEFAAGNFGKPLATHGETPDGVAEMIRLKGAVTYRFENLKNGGRVRITAATGEGRDAVHAFLRYQIREHATGDPLTLKKMK